MIGFKHLPLISLALLLPADAYAEAQIPVSAAGILPALVDNSTNKYFPGIGNQGNREACSNAAGIGYVFSYEINAARDVSGALAENRYPFFYTYDFLNDGSEKNGTYRMFLDAWKIVRENGIANLVDFGDDDLSSTRWMSGYDRYYRGMRNRVERVDSLEMNDVSSLRKMKQWLVDHGSGEKNGGIFLFTAYIYGFQEVDLPSGPEAGKAFVKYWGSNHDSTSLHAMTIVGYNDSVRFDYNGDGKCTNTLDISDQEGKLGAKDGKVEIADWEIGAFIVANSWGTSWGDRGFAYASYRSLVSSFVNGGILSNNRLYFLTVKKDYAPKLALKVSITDTLRNTTALSVGVAADPGAAMPSKIRRFERQFTYAGGAFPMCGSQAPGSIEIGFDISDLMDSAAGSAAAKFFIVVDSKARGGFVDSLSVMDYTSGTLVQTKSPQTGVALAPGTPQSPARTCVGVAWAASGVRGQPAAPAHGRPYFQIARRLNQVMLRVAGGAASIELLNANGKRCSLLRGAFDGDWISVPSLFNCGMYLARITARDGKIITRAAVVGR
jgi:hypothetical protein